GRHSLLNTAALQALVTGLAAAAADEGVVAPGPEVGPLHFTAAAGGDPDTLRLDVRLVQEGGPPAPVPLVAATFDPAYFQVQRFDAAGSPPWQDVTPPAGNVTYSDTPAPAFTLTFDAGAL